MLGFVGPRLGVGWWAGLRIGRQASFGRILDDVAVEKSRKTTTRGIGMGKISGALGGTVCFWDCAAGSHVYRGMLPVNVMFLVRRRNCGVGLDNGRGFGGQRGNRRVVVECRIAPATRVNL